MAARAKTALSTKADPSKTTPAVAGMAERKLPVRQKIARLTPEDRAIVLNCIERLLAGRPLAVEKLPEGKAKKRGKTLPAKTKGVTQ